MIKWLRNLKWWSKIVVGVAGFTAGSTILVFILSLFDKKDAPEGAFIMVLFPVFVIAYPIAFYHISAGKKFKIMNEKTINIRCPNCKYEGEGKTKTPGFFALELILYLFFVIPGLAYTLWRVTNKKPVCPQCSFEYVVKL